MSTIIEFLLYTYIFFGSWTLAYNLHELLPIPNIIMILSIFLYSLFIIKTKKIVSNVYNLEDFLLFLFLLIMIVSFVVNGGNKNYIIAYIFIFLFNYLFIKSAYLNFIDINKAFRVNGIAIIFVSLFIITEFTIQYIFKINIREVLLFGDIPSATYLGVFQRSYGFSTEPTNLGLYLNVLGPLGIWYWIKYRTVKTYKSILIIMIIILGWSTTFSAAAFFSLFASLILVAFIYILPWLKNKVITKWVPVVFVLFSLLVSILILYINTGDKDLSYFFQPIINKITLVGQIDQEESRINLWIRDLASFKENPILGSGPGMTTIYYGVSSVNWYLNILVENGILAFLIILFFFFITFLRIHNSRIHNKYYFLVGFLSGVIHLSAVSTFYDPALWILLILFNVYNEINLLEENNAIS